MKKLILLFLVVLTASLASTQSFAQEKPLPDRQAGKHKKPRPDNDSLFIFNRHKTIFYLGYGLGAINNNYISPYSFQTDKSTQVGPVYFKVEKALTPKVSIVLSTYLQYDTWSSSLENDVPIIPVTYTRTYKRLSYGALARFNYHAKVNRKFDGFIGGGAGYKNEKWDRSANLSYDYNDNPPAVSHFAFEATIGLRYLLGPHWLAYVEAGYSKSIFQTGISFNIPKP